MSGCFGTVDILKKIITHRILSSYPNKYIKKLVKFFAKKMELSSMKFDNKYII